MFKGLSFLNLDNIKGMEVRSLYQDIYNKKIDAKEKKLGKQTNGLLMK